MDNGWQRNGTYHDGRCGNGIPDRPINDSAGLGIGADGNLWVTDVNYFSNNTMPFHVVDYTGTLLHTYQSGSSTSQGVGIVFGPDGNIWGADQVAGNGVWYCTVGGR